MDLVIFDIETTGFSHTWSEIIQIAAVRMRDGCLSRDETFSTFIRPARSIPAFITDITGITDTDVRDAPCASEALLSFSRFADNSLLLGHNARRFDMPFIRASCARLRLSVRQVQFADSLDFSRTIWGGRGGHGLDDIMARLEITDIAGARHTAPGDVSILAKVVLRMWTQLSPDFQTCPIFCEWKYLPA